MSDDRMNLELGVSVHTEGTDKLSDLDKLLLRIKAAQDKFNSSLGQGGTKASQAAKAALNVDRDRLRVLKMQMGYESKARRDSQRETERANRDAARDVTARLREEQRAIREMGRLRRQEAAAALAAEREVTRERSRAVQRVGSGLSRAGGGARRLAGVGAAAAAASTYAAQRAVDGLTRAGMTIDEAMTQSMVHIFGEQDTAKSRKSAEALRQKLLPVSSRLATKTADIMGAYVEAAQAGVSDDLLDVTVEQGTKYAKLNKLNVPDVLEQSGYALNGLKAFGAVTADIVKKYYDETSFLIATTSANRKELLSFTRTGLASGASIGMNMSETLAFGGAVTAAGGEGQQASRMLSTQGTRIADWRNRGTNILRKHHRDANDRQFLDAVQILGYRDSDAMADSFSKDFFGSLVNAQDKLKGISDPLKRKSITGQLFGKEFGALIDSMIMGGNMREFRGKLDNAGGYLNKSWDKFTTGFGFIMDKLGVVMSNVTESMGIALKPLWGEVSAWIDRFQGFGRMGEAVTNFTNGLIRGFGANSVTELLNRVLGDPSKFALNMSTVFQAGKGFAGGITSVGTGIKNLFSAFAGPNADAQAMGKLTGQILALSAALTVAAPALVVLGSLTAILTGLGAAGAGVAGLLGGGARAAGAAGTAAGAGAMGAAVLSKAGQLIGLAFLAEVAQRFNVLKMDDSKGLFGNILEEFVPAPLRRWLDSDKGSIPGQGQGWQDVGESKRLAEMRASLDKNTAETKRNTESTRDAANKAAETKAAEIKAEETKRLSELVGIRNAALSGSVGGGGPSTADQLRSRGFNVVGEGGGTTGAMPTANGGDTASPEQKSGGSRSWRNNNPGNIEFGPFAKSMGATSSDGRFARFPTYEAGRRAQEKLLFESGSYKDLTLGQAIRRWAPGSENNVPAYIRAMGGDNPNMRMSDYSPQQRAKLLDMMQAHEGWRPGTVAGGGSGGGSSLPGMGGQSVALDNARRLLGAGSRQAAAALGSKMTPGEWCADFVNGALKSANIRGVQSSIANSYLNWGQQVTDGVKAGDVVVTHRGRGVGQTGGHVGLATGQTRVKNGRLQYQTISGNHGNAVGEGWEYADKVAVRRAQEDAQRTSDMAARIGARPTPPAGANAGASPSPGTNGPQSLLSVPQAAPPPRNITSGVPQGGGRRGGGGAGGAVNVHIGTVNAKDGKDAGEQIGEKVRSAINSHYGDVDGYGYA